MVYKPIETLIFELHTRLRWVDGAERIVFGIDLHQPLSQPWITRMRDPTDMPHNKLKVVDFPTFGRPTMPIFT